MKSHGTIIFLHNRKTAGITVYNLLRRKLVLLGNHCGWRSTAVRSYNKADRGRSGETASEIGDADRDALIEANQLDLEFYEQVKKRFASDVADFGEAWMESAIDRHQKQCRAAGWRLRLVDDLTRMVGKLVR